MLATTLYTHEVTGLDYHNRAGCYCPVSAVVEYKLVDAYQEDESILEPEIVGIYFDEWVDERKDGIRRQAMEAFADDWKEGKVKI